MGNKNIIYNIVDSFLKMENPSESLAGFFRRWIVDENCREEKDSALERQWNRMNAMLDSIDDSDKYEVQFKMMEHVEKSSARKGFYMRWHTAAAAVVLIVGLASYSLWSWFQDTEVEKTCYVTSAGSKGDFFLPDGSHVWMNANSRLEFSDEFNYGHERKVSVKGEAFFDVVKGRKPFIVSLGDDVNVTVHGTRFNVRNTDVFESVQVVLQSGSVEVSSGSGSRTMLVPGTCYTYNNSSGTYSINRVNTANFSNWTKPYIAFKDETLRNILITLEHWYNTKIIVENDVDTTQSLSFTIKSESIEDTFSLLQILTKYRCIVVDKNHVVISK